MRGQVRDEVQEMENNIEIYAECHVDDKIPNDLKVFTGKVLDYINPDFPLSISITITDNEDIRAINKEHRGMDKPTDVLSFPMIFWGSPEVLKEKLSDCDYDMETGLVYLGDLIISIEKIKEQAAEYGHSFERELFYLTIHGILHLFGYDHIEASDKKLMRIKEEELYSEIMHFPII